MRRKACEAGEKWGRDDENKDRGESKRASRWEERVGYESGLQH